MRLVLNREALKNWVNGLAEPWRSYVIWLETDTDPTGNIREAACQRENALALVERVRELEAEKVEYLREVELTKRETQLLKESVDRLFPKNT